MSYPKPQIQSMNGKRLSSQRMQQENVSPQHEELIKYIYESWNKVSREADIGQNGSSSNKGMPSVSYYQPRETNPQLKDFKAFDLEAWWGQRVVQSITGTQSM
ncbi:MAPK regulated corepressor interacting protein 2-like [Ischnura elegans]|uniref:MAPK regulated corepressor interacting protein 2-like n=1 Tax=Ischnura elegans TaxID=197161 RepID=UPI001ED88665|nr:MAPK regulated corepressor interacting protein 2-like [Ischnura elegans]